MELVFLFRIFDGPLLDIPEHQNRNACFPVAVFHWHPNAGRRCLCQFGQCKSGDADEVECIVVGNSILHAGFPFRLFGRILPFMDDTLETFGGLLVWLLLLPYFGHAFAIVDSRIYDLRYMLGGNSFGRVDYD